MKLIALNCLPKYSVQCTCYEGRQYYSVPGQVYTGITTILSATRSKEDEQRFKDWEEEVGVAEAQRIRRESTRRGGITDGLVNYDGQLCFCDWKTSTKPKKWNWIQEHCLQVAAYTAAVNRVYQSQGVRVAQALIAIALPHTEAQVFRIEQEALMEYWQAFKQRLEQFKTMQ